MQKQRTILLVAAAAILLLVVAVIYIFNKPHRDVSGEHAIIVSADSLFSAFSNNEENANRLYLDKALVVEGTVQETLTNQQGQHVILFKTPDPVAAVSATFQQAPKTIIAIGAHLKIRGICSGYANDVVLRDCMLDENN